MSRTLGSQLIRYHGSAVCMPNPLPLEGMQGNAKGYYKSVSDRHGSRHGNPVYSRPCLAVSRCMSQTSPSLSLSLLWFPKDLDVLQPTTWHAVTARDALSR